MSQNPDQSIPDHAGVAFKPPVLLLIFIVIGFACRLFIPLNFLPRPWPLILGPLIIVAALALFITTVRTMSGAQTGIDPDSGTAVILKSGPFRISRNPIYLSMVFLLIGIGISANTLWFIGLAIVFFFLLSWGVISREELYLEKKFGEDYLSYKGEVRRWL
ncbi:MAG: isoprenylcysteine carboxylmethyltransferase family protein [Chloroflexota bacterium]